jgi:2TM domain
MSTTHPDVRNELVAASDEGLRDQALRTIKQRRDFHTHLFIYLTINLVVWGVWVVIGAMSGSWWPWPLFLTLAWGVGVVANAWDIFLRRPITETELQQEMEHLRSHR